MNCAQSVIRKFKGKYGIGDETVKSFKVHGGGRAPDGLCGAFFAAKYILKKNIGEHKIVELEKSFLEEAGSIKCREIRGLKKLSCSGCIQKSTQFLNELE